MEFALSSRHLQYREPIHVNPRKQAPNLFPNTKPKKHRPDHRFKHDSPHKSILQDPARISTIDSEELQNYMNCGGIKLNNRFGRSIQRDFKKGNLVAAQTDALPKVKFGSASRRKLHISHRLLHKRSQCEDNPETPTLLAPISQHPPPPEQLKILPPQVISLSSKTQSNGNGDLVYYGFHLQRNCYVTVYPCIQKLKIIKHPNVLPTLGLYAIEDKVFQVTEIIQGLSLRNLLIQFGCMAEQTARIFVRQLVEGIKAMHRQGLRHNRINLDNVLHNKEGKIWINPFTACQQPPNQKERNLYTYYFPPETLLSKERVIQSRNDVWGIGCITLQLVTEKSVRLSPYHPYNFVTSSLTETDDVLSKVKKLMANESQLLPQRIDLTGECSESALDFISRCMSIRYDGYPSASELLKHPFLALTE